jgi:iron complex outermembrane receptor protein
MRAVAHRKLLLLASAAAGVLACARPAFAEGATAEATAPSTSVESVVVTARRRPETLFNVAAPVTVVSGDTIKAFDIKDMKSLIDLVPNASVPKSPDNYQLYINIRGIQQTDVQAQPNFGVYRNGFYAGGERPSAGPLIDIDRVEVEAGPQAGLYGRDAVGGAINVIYQLPRDKFGGYLTASYGNFDRAEVQGAINIPVNDTFALRATGWYENQNKGELYNATLNQYEDRNTEDGGRLTAKWTPTKDFSAVWMAEYSNNAGPATEAYAPYGITNGVITSAPETPTRIYRDTPDRNWNNQYYLSQDLKYASGFGTFEWLASYSDYHMHDIEDEDKTAIGPTDGPLADQFVLQRKEQVRDIYTELLWFSPEDQPLTATAGISYFDQTFDFQRLYTLNVDLSLLSGALYGGAYGYAGCAALLGDPTCSTIPGATAGNPFPNIGVQSAQIAGPGGGSQINTRSYSGFIDATFHFNKEWSITGALRYTDDEEHLNFHQFPIITSAGSPQIIALVADLFPVINLEHNYPYTNLSPSAELNYKPNQSLNLYALYSTGFRAGGFNTVTTTASLIPYGSEKAQNFEIGAKTLWLNGRLGVNLDAFYMIQKDLLTYEPDPIAPAQYGFYYLANVGQAVNYGVEFSSVAKITSWWSAAVSVGWLHAQKTQGVSYGVSQAGQPLENTRVWTIDARTQFRYPLRDDYAILGGVNWHVEEGGYLDILTLKWPTLNRFDATFGVAKGDTSIVGFVNNAFNSRPADFVYGNGATTLVDGETYGVRISTKF